MLETAWTYTDDAAVVYTADSGVVDLRASYALRLSEEVLDDSLLVFKDRDSTGSNKIDGDIEVNNITVSGLTAGTGDFSSNVIAGGYGLFTASLGVRRAVGADSGNLYLRDENSFPLGRLNYTTTTQKLGFTDGSGVFNKHLNLTSDGYLG